MLSWVTDAEVAAAEVVVVVVGMVVVIMGEATVEAMVDMVVDMVVEVEDTMEEDHHPAPLTTKFHRAATDRGCVDPPAHAKRRRQSS